MKEEIRNITRMIICSILATNFALIILSASRLNINYPIVMGFIILSYILTVLVYKKSFEVIKKNGKFNSR